jgi:release factor glutamine methyltransferase
MENQSISVGSVFNLFRAELKNTYDNKEIDQFLNILFLEWKGWNRAVVRLNFGKLLSIEETAGFYNALEGLKSEKPIQYITGKTYFLDLELLVTPDVLIPRPETEELADLIIKEQIIYRNKESSILDIGTGSGCIALAMKKSFPGSSVTAMDHSEKALKVTRANAEKNDCQVRFYQFDILQKKSWPTLPAFNIIISNPPYITESEKKGMRKNVLDYEPPGALFVPDNDPLVYYKAIADFASLHLTLPGFLYLEINEGFGSEIETLLLINQFSKVAVIKDLNGKDRFVRAEMNNRLVP